MVCIEVTKDKGVLCRLKIDTHYCKSWLEECRYWKWSTLCSIFQFLWKVLPCGDQIPVPTLLHWSVKLVLLHMWNITWSSFKLWVIEKPILNFYTLACSSFASFGASRVGNYTHRTCCRGRRCPSTGRGAPKNIPLFTAKVAGPSDPPGRGAPLGSSEKLSSYVTWRANQNFVNIRILKHCIAWLIFTFATLFHYHYIYITMRIHR